MDVFVKPMKKTNISGKKLVYLKDIAEVYSTGGSQGTLENVIVLKITENNKKSYLISIIDVIKAIDKAMPDATVSNVGEMATIIEYRPEAVKTNKIITAIKVFIISVILFIGASTAIMSFHSDVQLPQIFSNYYEIFYGTTVDVPYILYIPYSIGILVGIIIFYNHFSKISITLDPTPIEVQMTTYEKETTDNVIDSLEKESRK